MLVPTSFTISPSSQIGDVYGTEFSFIANLPSEYTTFVWNFGDGILDYSGSSVSHTYNYPGIYTIELSAWADDFLYTDTATINVDYVYRDAVTFKQIPSGPGIPGISSGLPFVVSLTSAKIDIDNTPLSIVLQPFNTKSVPYYAVPDKWNFLTPRWRFVDATTKQILHNPVVLSAVPIFKDGKVVAVKAETSFYYVDDLSTGTDPINDCPLLISATLSTERFSYPLESLIYPYASYSNSEVARAIISWQINDIIPTKLNITENVLDPVYPIKWAGVPMPVMITTEADTALLSSFSDIDENYTTAALSYPRTNEIGNKSSVVVSLSSNATTLLPGVHFSASNDLFFQATDNYGNIASGYIFTTITPFTSILTALSAYPNSTIVVTASTVATNQNEIPNVFGFPAGYPLHPSGYIAHPSKGTINKVTISTYPKDCSDAEYYRNLGILSEGSISFTSIPTISTTDLINYSLSGTAGVYGMAFNPTKNVLYTCDVDQNTVSSYYAGNELLTSVQLSSIFGSETLAPSHVSIDRDNNIWISLFDGHTLAKFDSNLNYLLSAYPMRSLTSVEVPLGDQNTFNSPPVVETDIHNDVWACYPDIAASLLVKFDSNGNELFRAESLPIGSYPVSLTINATNGAWVACKNSNNLFEFDTYGTLMQTVTGLLCPSYIASDRSNNVWIAHGYNLCSVYNTTLSTLSTWKISTLSQTVVQLHEYSNEDRVKAQNEDEIWGGLAVDVYDRVWLIDSAHNKGIILNSKEPTNFRIFDVMPYADTAYVFKTGDTFITNVSTKNVRSAQASGDWTGNRWYQKYTGIYNTLPIRGVSAPFKLYDLDNSFQVAKVNEEFNCADYFKSLALPEVLHQNSNLFDKFFAAVVGDGNPTTESAGRVVYERIANFVATHGDFETAEIDQLLSIANQLSVEAETFGNSFPTAINRLLNLFSISKQQLRGVPNLETDITKNVGPVLSETSLITADKFYFIKDRRYDIYQLIYANTREGHTTYPLLSVEVEGLREPILDNYYFFEYNDQNHNGYTGNVIDWDSKFTTISYNLSTNEEWYGDGGLVETMFNNLLTKQLYQQ